MFVGRLFQREATAKAKLLMVPFKRSIWSIVVPHPCYKVNYVTTPCTRQKWSHKRGGLSSGGGGYMLLTDVQGVKVGSLHNERDLLKWRRGRGREREGRGKEGGTVLLWSAVLFGILQFWRFQQHRMLTHLVYCPCSSKRRKINVLYWGFRGLAKLLWQLC